MASENTVSPMDTQETAPLVGAVLLSAYTYFLQKFANWNEADDINNKQDYLEPVIGKNVWAKN